MPPAQTPSASPLDVVQSGDGVPVLLIHGIYGSGVLFAPLAATLADRYRVIAPDLRGHGESGSIAGSLEAGAVATDLVPTLDRLGVDRVHVIGHSHGGAVAQEFARLAPSRLRSLTLVSTYAFQPLTWWERLGGHAIPWIIRALGTRHLAALARIGRSAGRGRRLTVGAATAFAGQMSRNEARTMARAFVATRSFDSRPWLGEIRVPTLVVVGEADRMVSSGQSRLLVDGIPGARLQAVAGAGHMLPLSHPDVFAAIVGNWLAEVDALTPPAGGIAPPTAGTGPTGPGLSPLPEHRTACPVPAG